MKIYNATEPGSVRLLPGELYDRYKLNLKYMMSLDCDKLLLNFYNEAGLVADSLPNYTLPEGVYTGWESPTCQLRGHFLGHYLSACAWGWRYMGNHQLKGRGDHIVKELRRCQLEHGDGWAFSIPELYLEWIARGKHIWAPQYTIHKTLMGLMDMYRFAGNELALAVCVDAAEWFYNFSGRFTEDEFDTVMDTETGGMMEFFADLYGETGDPKHKQLMERYFRRHLYVPLMRGEDVLSNMHANTTIPETLGVARAYEVTGDSKYLDTVRAYWDMAVTNRGYFVTGGQTCYEAWTSPFKFADRLGDENQEHCVVYNMIRLADFLFRETGETAYQDYIERNYRNGILAQQHQGTGMVAYYLPMQPGGKANWGTPTSNFWCCHGTLVQVHMLHASNTLYFGKGGDTLLVAQYRPVKAELELGGKPVVITVAENFNNPSSRICPDPKAVARSIDTFHGRMFKVRVQAESAFKLQLRIPWWADGETRIIVNGETAATAVAGTVVTLEREWKGDEIELNFASSITVHPLPDDTNRMAFMDGPDVLIGLTDNDALSGRAGELIRQESRNAYLNLKILYRAIGQPENVPFIRLSELGDERYTMYFTVKDEQ